MDTKRKDSLSPFMWLAIATAVALVLFLILVCDEARPAGIVVAVLWVPLIYGMFRVVKRSDVLAVGVAFALAELTLIGTVLLTCPGGGGRSALAVGLAAFLVFGLIFGVSVKSFQDRPEE